MVLLPVALYRGRLIPLSVVGPAAAAVAIEAFPASAVDLSLAKYALALATAAAIAARIMRLSDDQWAPRCYREDRSWDELSSLG
ncbi:MULTISPECIES: hypothetical protein [Kribbella]|uniref:hypothetical protein n=1 Tax=Kribbella TaxID=182639 RepID=UPI0010536EE9|nr:MULTISPECIES: hypothetical protein [Kribbella]